MSSVKPVGFSSGNEELAAVGVGPSIGHREAVGLVFEVEVFVSKSLAMDGMAASSVSFGEITTLNHEIRDDAMEGATHIGELVSVVKLESSAKLYKVMNSHRDYLSIQINFDVSCLLSTDSDAHGHLISDFFLS